MWAVMLVGELAELTAVRMVVMLADVMVGCWVQTLVDQRAVQTAARKAYSSVASKVAE